MRNDGLITQSSGRRAAAHFHSGLHCAEAVVAAIQDEMGERMDQAVAHATPFGGGVGRSFDEMCGALSGGLILIGHFHGRTVADQGWDVPARMGRKLRESFLEQFQSTHCATLRERFGEEKQMQECAKIVECVAEKMYQLLNQSQERYKEKYLQEK